jgi:hypothetical protein
MVGDIHWRRVCILACDIVILTLSQSIVFLSNINYLFQIASMGPAQIRDCSAPVMNSLASCFETTGQYSFSRDRPVTNSLDIEDMS